MLKGPLFAQFLNPPDQAGDFAAGGILMNLAIVRGAHEFGLGRFHGGDGLGAVTGRDCILNQTDGVAHARTPRLVDLGAARNLTDCLAGGRGGGHEQLSTKIQRRRGISPPNVGRL